MVELIIIFQNGPAIFINNPDTNLGKRIHNRIKKIITKIENFAGIEKFLTLTLLLCS